jgi:hypothetical protein
MMTRVARSWLEMWEGLDQDFGAFNSRWSSVFPQLP